MEEQTDKILTNLHSLSIYRNEYNDILLVGELTVVPVHPLQAV